MDYDSEEIAIAYWASFGRFIHYFSTVEQKLHSLLWEISGVNFEVARAVFQDARFSNIVATINRIYESRNEDEHPMYRRAIDHLGEINKMRNDLVHSPVALTDKGAVVSNRIKAMPAKRKELIVTAELLDDMCRDLTTALACLTIVLSDRNALPENARALRWQEIAQRPWLYKPLKQSGKARERRAHPQERKRPRAPLLG
jgi:hypothetical protein